MALSNKVLVFRIGQLGDTLVGLPALRVIREAHSNSKIDLLYDHHVGSNFVLAEDLLAGSGVIDGFIPYYVGRSPADKIKAVFLYPKLISQLRRNHYKIVYHLEPGQKTKLRNLRDQLFFRLAGIKKQSTSSPYRRRRPSDTPLTAVEPEVDFYLRVLKLQGLPVPPEPSDYIELQTGEKENHEWRSWLGSHPLPADKILVGVGAGSKMQSKQWPLDRYTSVLRELCKEENVFPVFFGGKEDADPINEMIDNLGVGISACGDLSLKGAIRGLRDMTFYLGNDTGTMHMAVSAGLKCVAVFSARDVPGKWYPYGEGHYVHRNAVDCEGCMLTSCIVQKKKCLDAISVEEVLASCRRLLASSGVEI